MGSDFTYSPTVGQTVGVMAGLTVITGIVNSLSTYWMEKMTKTYVIFHVLVLVTCSIALLALSHKAGTNHTAKYVFTNVDNTSGWEPTGWSFMFGFLSGMPRISSPPSFILHPTHMRLVSALCRMARPI